VDEGLFWPAEMNRSANCFHRFVFVVRRARNDTVLDTAHPISWSVGFGSRSFRHDTPQRVSRFTLKLPAEGGHRHGRTSIAIAQQVPKARDDYGAGARKCKKKARVSSTNWRWTPGSRKR
jgi:hypothetical protein